MNRIYLLAEKLIFDSSKDLLIDNEHREVEIKLGTNESRLLFVFCNNPKKVLSRKNLNEQVWINRGFQVDDSSLTQAISTLRKNLGDSANFPEFVKTVPKSGYQLIADVVSLESEYIGETSDVFCKADENTFDFKLEIDNDVGEKLIEVSNSRSVEPLLVAPSHKKNYSLYSILIILLVGAILDLIDSQKNELIEIDKIRNVPILSSLSDFSFSSIQQVVNVCVESALTNESNRELPSKIIVSYSSFNSVILNFLYDNSEYGMNKTIYINQSDNKLEKLCILGGDI
ncbi:hypothetical protein BA894_01195 [Vibrio natriegens]|uniref:winged helix-turn-helix domain-containing protein n=1 Tax=Vibrio natriegens TaxID=691 RepID=UPI00080425E5|nr:winged helix-turn-helix domain-containing protein [Vibrio natriegens]ANQ25149.1 hypothetical protein BA894_01195 [Vibrio natriegens]